MHLTHTPQLAVTQAKKSSKKWNASSLNGKIVGFNSHNDCYHNDRFCHWRVYRFWHGHGSYRPTFILDKKMNAYQLAEYLQSYANEETDYDIDYHIYASKMLILQAQEIKALREQLIELQ